MNTHTTFLPLFHSPNFFAKIAKRKKEKILQQRPDKQGNKFKLNNGDKNKLNTQTNE